MNKKGGNKENKTTCAAFAALFFLTTQYSSDAHRADINNDGKVDIFDLVLMGGNFGKTSAAGLYAAYGTWTP